MKIEMKDIYKSFGKNDVLKGVDFTLNDGEIHALVGENGAGKSTLMNILSGVLSKDKGEILIDGKEVDISDTNVAKKYGISFIHQELSDWPELTVMDNIFMNNEIKNGIFLDKAKMRKKCIELLERFDLDINPKTKVSELSVGQRQMMEIAKANLNKVNVLILDEPTSALTNNEIDKLFKLIKRLRDKNVSMIYISHRMEEIFSLTNKITVMRDGKSVSVMDTNKTDEREVVSYMVGRDIGDFYPEMDAEISDVKIELKNFNREGFFKDINIKAKKGEVLGISGLMGAGRTEIMRSVFGLDPKDSGEVFIDGKKIEIKNPADAIKNKIGFVTENRQEEGLILDESIRENISLLNFDKFSKNSFIDKAKEKNLSDNLVDSFKVKTQSSESKISDLSGGNQQKVVFAKWYAIGPEILILDEPTKGVDVGAKREIYDLIKDLTNKGVSIILISSDLPELISLSNRIYVIHEGKIQGELLKKDASQEKIMTLATGGRL
ncbi:sugar ABC transporter ATP-binding protein [Anaerococcus obesiensis]|uniref:Sugar ABC transporter ATP-binding protein n=1 Tax=Anaerococcus obesiensis TaxID=1287640 RepID=A0A7T7UUX8_9FIRM|nr:MULTISPECIES: sugar ABC transporter ATP-binding protein [Anaerococcus]MBS4889253.1 sugar ABC transporter ATP-binding protein [Anaerococcus vaginalis]MDU1029778.1 sugar ABC transporter ATP-binding protein [Anaerococcus vaginalis]QQN56647.1 sugar ABC transporter ATP-binding protein [Anaerococcus obesiensis]